MKTEQEIRDEIEAAERTIENYRNGYKNGSISKGTLVFKNQEYINTVSVLKWVLGENDR